MPARTRPIGFWLTVIVIMAVVVLFVDLMIPLGVAAGVFYVAVILCSLNLPSRRYVIGVAVACSALTIIGLVVSPPPGSAETWKVLLNRGLAMFAIWVTALGVLWHKWAEGELRSLSASLEQRVAERTAELRESEERYRDVCESAGDLIHSVAPDGSFVYVNSAWRSSLGYNDDDLANVSLFDIIHPDSQAHCQELFQRVMAGETLKQIEAKFVTKDGRTITVEGSTSCKFENGEPVVTRGIFKDITDRKAAEQLLAKQSEDLEAERRAALSLAHDAEEARARLERANEELRFAFVAAQGEIETSSEKSTIVRETGDELTGIVSFDDALDAWARQARDLIGAHQSAVSYFPHGKIAEGKHAISLSDKYEKYRTYDVLPTGEGIWNIVIREKISFCLTDEELKSHPAWKNFSEMRDDRGLEHPPMRGWLAVPVLSRDQEFVGFLQLSDKYEGDFTQEDLQRITRLAHLMAPSFSLQFANEKLQGSNQELAHANEALEQSNVELQRFAYIASHDLQTPLRGIAGFAQLLQKNYGGQLDEQADDYIHRIVDGARRMKALINDLLAFSRVESWSAPFQPTRLNEALEDAIALLHTSIEDAQGEVTCDGLPTVMGDRSQLSQLLQNLIGNAIKYRSDRPPRVHVSVESNGSEWTIAVRDNGIGVDAKHHEKIFDIFRRLHTQDKYPGTGIGLAVCRRIVQRHGGEIRVDSEEGQGSTFYFTIPNQGSEQS